MQIYHLLLGKENILQLIYTINFVHVLHNMYFGGG